MILTDRSLSLDVIWHQIDWTLRFFWLEKWQSVWNSTKMYQRAVLLY